MGLELKSVTRPEVFKVLLKKLLLPTGDPDLIV